MYLLRMWALLVGEEIYYARTYLMIIQLRLALTTLQHIDVQICDVPASDSGHATDQ